MGEHPVRVAREFGEQVPFRRREMDALPIAQDGAARQVNRDPPARTTDDASGAPARWRRATRMRASSSSMPNGFVR
jgi:hypothetical protein